MAAGGGDVPKAAKVLLPVFERDKGKTGDFPSRRTRSVTATPRDRGAGGTLQRAGTEHDRQDPRDCGRDRGDRGGHVSRGQHQRDGELHAAAGHRCGRGGGAGLTTTGEGEEGHLHAWGRCAR